MHPNCHKLLVILINNMLMKYGVVMVWPTRCQSPGLSKNTKTQNYQIECWVGGGQYDERGWWMTQGKQAADDMARGKGWTMLRWLGSGQHNMTWHKERGTEDNPKQGNRNNNQIKRRMGGGKHGKRWWWMMQGNEAANGNTARGKGWTKLRQLGSFQHNKRSGGKTQCETIGWHLLRGEKQNNTT